MELKKLYQIKVIDLCTFNGLINLKYFDFIRNKIRFIDPALSNGLRNAGVKYLF